MLGFSAIGEAAIGETPVASGGGPVTVTVTAAAILMDGQAVAVSNGATMTAAQIAYSGVPVAVASTSFVTIVAGVIGYAGQSVLARIAYGGTALIQFAGRFINTGGVGAPVVERLRKMAFSLGLHF